jgi:hypothetical protein
MKRAPLGLLTSLSQREYEGKIFKTELFGQTTGQQAGVAPINEYNSIPVPGKTWR